MGLFLEREPFGDIDGDIDEETSLRAFNEEVEAEGMRGFLGDDPVARLYYKRFISCSQGRDRHGKRRNRRQPIEVELVGWGRKECIQLKEDGTGGLDRMAEAVLDGIVPPDRALDELIQRLRALPELRRIARGKK